MEKGMQRCMRCHGRKRIFKVGNAYCLVDSGGVAVDCPMCLGKGIIQTLDSKIDTLTSTTKMEGSVNAETSEKEKRIIRKKETSSKK